eukprot:GFKZ01008628.1.p1 GENE.GFKZ01008628.1~~GFKZ01008628.1.p1  ORF type:complete len:894 (+),score=232.55 GFKZ01008628.1:323-3004(+)
MPRQEILSLGEPVWARMEGYPWWPGRVVTLDEVVVDENEEIPIVDEDSHLIEFFNDNKRFASMHKSSLKSFLNPRNDNLNRAYSGAYLGAVKKATRECRQYVKDKKLEYKSPPRSKSSTGSVGRKSVSKREPRSERSDGDTDQSIEEHRRSKKRRQSDPGDGTPEKLKDDKGTESSTRKRKKRKNADLEEDPPSKTGKTKRISKRDDNAMETSPPPDEPGKDTNRKSEPTLEAHNATEKDGPTVGKRKETKVRRDVKPKKMTAKRIKEGSSRGKDEKIVKDEPVRIKAEPDLGKRDVKPITTKVKASMDKERSGSERGAREGENATKGQGQEADPRHEQGDDKAGDDKAGEDQSKRDEHANAPEGNMDTESIKTDDVYGTLSRRQLVEVVNNLEKEVRTYRMELRQLYQSMGRTRDFIETPGDFFKMIAPGFGVVAEVVAKFEKEPEMSSEQKQNMEEDAIEKLDRILRAHVSREALKVSLQKVSRRAVKLATKVMPYSVKIARVMREIVVQWLDVVVIESVSSVGGEDESQMARKGQDEEKKGPADEEEKRDVGDRSVRYREKGDSGDRKPEKLKECSAGVNEGRKAEDKVTKDTNLKGGDKPDVDMVDVERQEAQHEKEGREKSKVTEEQNAEDIGENGENVSGKEEESNGARKDAEVSDGSKKQAEENKGSEEKGGIKSEARKEGEKGSGASVEGEDKKAEKEKAEDTKEARKEGELNSEARREAKLDDGARKEGDESSEAKKGNDESSGARKEREVKDNGDENNGDRARKVSPSERHERRVREFTRERCLDTFKKVLHPLKGSEVKEVVVDDEKLEELAEALERAVEPTRGEDMHRYFEKSRKVLKVLTGSSQSRNEVLKCVIAKNNIKTFVGRCLNNEFVKDKESNGN